MDTMELASSLATESDSKIVLLVVDGLGGLPSRPGGQTELEAARTPNLDRLARRSSLGLIDPVSPGITPGSGPSHLALFGYDPFKYDVGRGVLSALGVGFELEPRDIAARINFATIDESGVVTDRRAGRISTELNAQLCKELQQIEIPGVKIFPVPEKEHRAALIIRGENLSGELSDSDPQHAGVPPLPVRALSPEAEATAHLVNEFVRRALKVLSAHKPANAILLRGFDKCPTLPPMDQLYRMKTAAIATYPMYKGLARLVGMALLETGQTIADELACLAGNFADHHFFYLHVKATDTAGEDGDFERKKRVIEEVDTHIPALLGLKPDVLIVTGDHSTPSKLKLHSWHPVPLLLYSVYCRPDGSRSFSERACQVGGLGRMPATQVMPLALANALRLNKYGA